MAKKSVKKKAAKSVKKAAKKSTSKKKVSRSKSPKRSSAVKPTDNRIRLALRDLLLFVILSMVSYLIYTVSGNTLYEQFFGVVSIILGFIALAFLVAVLVLVLMKAMKKK